MKTDFFDDSIEPLNDPELPIAPGVIPQGAKKFLYDQSKLIMGRMIGYKDLRMIYASAIKVVKTKLEILSTEFSLRYHRNPISAVHSRLKSTASIMKKLDKLGCKMTLESIEDKVNDVAGVRVICSYVDDIYLIADAITKQSDVELLLEKDYVASPKPNGYRSLHLIVKVPVYLSDKRVDTKVEIQIRTIAMDFWASLEHQLRYKKDSPDADVIVDELRECAESINSADVKMSELRLRMESMEEKSSDDELFERFSKFDMPID